MPLQQVHTGFTFGFDRSKLGAIETGVKRTASNLKTVTEKTNAFGQRMGAFYARAKGVIGAYVGFRAIRAITTDYAKGADAVAKFSKGLGISSQQYQRLTHAAQLNGLSIEELNVALPNLAKNAGNAADGSKAMQLAFTRAGVNVKDSAGKLKDPITLLTDLADGMQGIKDEGRKTQILMNLFGRSGKRMGVLLAQGSEGIKKAMAEADKLGIVLSGKQLKAAENFNDEMLRVKSVLLGVRNMIAARVLPAITRSMRAFQMWWREGRNAERALKALKLIAFLTALVVGRIITGMVIKQVTIFTRGIWGMVHAMRAANVASSLLAIKITAIFLVLAAVFLIIDDLVAFAQGRDSVIGRILGDSQLAKDLRNALLDMAKAAKQAWGEIGPALRESWEALKPALLELWKAIEPLIGPAFRIGIQLMIGSFKWLAWNIRIGTDMLKLQIATFKGFALGVGYLIKGIKFVVGWLIRMRDMAVQAKDALDVLRGRTVKARVSVASATEGLGQQLRAAAVGVAATPPAGFRTHQALPGVGAPTPALPGAGFPHQLRGGSSQVSNVTVGPGAVPITVNTSGDPQAMLRAINAEARRGLNKVFTAASRDLKKPPAGQ